MARGTLSKLFCCGSRAEVDDTLPPSKPIVLDTSSTSMAASEPSAFQRQADLIANKPVAGIARMPGNAGYINSINTRRDLDDVMSPVPSLAWDTATPSSASTEKWGKRWEGIGDEKSTPATPQKGPFESRKQQNAAKVTPIDRKEVLTEEDEETWSRMMM